MVTCHKSPNGQRECADPAYSRLRKTSCGCWFDQPTGIVTTRCLQHLTVPRHVELRVNEPDGTGVATVYVGPDRVLASRQRQAYELIGELLPKFTSDDDALQHLFYVTPDASPAIIKLAIGAALHFLRVGPQAPALPLADPNVVPNDWWRSGVDWAQVAQAEPHAVVSISCPGCNTEWHVFQAGDRSCPKCGQWALRVDETGKLFMRRMS